jgi:hypothetical protein
MQGSRPEASDGTFSRNNADFILEHYCSVAQFLMHPDTSGHFHSVSLIIPTNALMKSGPIQDQYLTHVQRQNVCRQFHLEKAWISTGPVTAENEERCGSALYVEVVPIMWQGHFVR